VQDGGGAECVVEVVGATAVISEHAPCLEPCDRVLDAGPASAMTTPCAIPDDAIVVKHRRGKLGNATIATVGEDPPVMLAELLDARATVVDWIVTIPWSSRAGRDDKEVSSSDQDLRVTRVSVVLRLRGTGVIAGWDQRAIDDPRNTPVAWRWSDEGGEHRREHRDDSMGRRRRDLRTRGELAEGEVGAQRDAGKEDAPAQRVRLRSPAPVGCHAIEASYDRIELLPGHGREHEHARNRHRQMLAVRRTA
jgi:hypothetical protein